MLATNRRPRFLRVLMISDVYFPRINGVSTSIETFRVDLAAEGIQVRLIAPAYPERHDAPATWRVPSRRIPFDPEDRLMHWQPLRHTAHHLAAEGVDLIHVQTPFAAHYAGTRTARRHNVPVLATYHTHFEEYIAHYLPALPRPLLRAAARRIATGQCNDLAAVVVPSHAMHETLTGYGVTAPLHILPTGIPVQSFAGGPREVTQVHRGSELQAPIGRGKPPQQVGGQRPEIHAVLRGEQFAHAQACRPAVGSSEEPSQRAEAG